MKTKEQVMEELNLDQLPDDEFMRLFAIARQMGEGPVKPGPNADRLLSEPTTPREIVEKLNTALVARNVGDLMAQARAEAGVTLNAVGEKIGVTKARVNQLERSENLEVATLVRLAGALGYKVGITLEPTVAGRKPLRVELEAKT